jgi:hypothetical protein
MKPRWPYPIVVTLFIAAATSQADTITVPRTEITRTATISLGYQVIDEVIYPPRSPAIFAPGTHLRISAPATNYVHPIVKWYHGRTLLPSTDVTLDLPALTPADAGSYSVMVTDADVPTSSVPSDSVLIAVSNHTPRLLNVSTRLYLDGSHSAAFGFVVDPSSGPAEVLIRAVGPSLSAFGVTGAAAAPTLTLLNAKQVAQNPIAKPGPPRGGLYLPDYPTVESASAAVGAFPLKSGSADLAAVYLLDAGSYTAQVTSADGKAGEVLIEVYEVPF